MSRNYQQPGASPDPTSGQLRRLWQIAAALSVLLAVITLFLTLTPNPPGPPSRLPLDKVAHFLAHFAIVLPICLIRPRAAIWLVPLATCFGVAIELIQPFFGRGRELGDMIANAFGALAGAGVGWALNPKLRDWLAKAPPKAPPLN